MEGNYEMCNGNLMVKLVENTVVNANGTFLKNSETRGKKDIVCGVLLQDGEELKKGEIIYFSLYASQPMQLENETVYIVHQDDVKFIKKGITNETLK
jgi:co-chaperonin GroES (HSP10)